MAKHQYSPTKGEVLSTTEARQASPRKANLRVLIFSTALIIVIFAGFVFAFVYKTPASMDNTDKTGVVSHPVTTIPQAPQGTASPNIDGTSNPAGNVGKQEAPSP